MSCFLFSGTGNIIFGALKIGKNNSEIANLEFENHGFLKNHVFLPTEQAGTNICSMVYQDINFKICLSLFGWKENILDKMHIVQCCKDKNVEEQKRAVRRVIWLLAPSQTHFTRVKEVKLLHPVIKAPFLVFVF